MLSVVTLEPHSVSPVHAHPNEQWRVCLEGEWIRVQDGVEHHVRAGDFWQTPPNMAPRRADARQTVRRAGHLRAAPGGIRQAGRGLGAAKIGG